MILLVVQLKSSFIVVACTHRCFNYSYTRCNLLIHRFFVFLFCFVNPSRWNIDGFSFVTSKLELNTNTYKEWSNFFLYLNFFKKVCTFFINYYLVAFKVTPLRYNTLMPAFFQPLKHFWNVLFVIPNSCSFNFSFISLIEQNAFLSSASSVLAREKIKRGSSPVNTVFKAWLRFSFWPKTHVQTSRWCVIMVQNPWLVFP